MVTLPKFLNALYIEQCIPPDPDPTGNDLASDSKKGARPRAKFRL